MDILSYILFGMLILAVISFVVIILINTKIKANEFFKNHPSGDRKFDKTLSNNKEDLEKYYCAKKSSEEVIET